MPRARATLPLLAALLGAGLLAGCSATGFHRVACATPQAECLPAVPPAPVCAPPPGARPVVVATVVAAPAPVAPRPVYDVCPFCGGTTVHTVQRSLGVDCYACDPCAVIVYAWPDGAAWAQQRCDDGIRSWRLRGMRAERVDCVPFLTPREPVRVVARRSEEPAGPRVPHRRAEARRGERGYDSGGGFLVSGSARSVGHPVALPGHPVARPAHPVTRPAAPVEPSGHPVPLPDAPVGRPAHPVERPAAPVGRPAHPVTLPAEPVGRPAHPVTPPAAPVARPAHPVEPASHPVVRRDAMAPAPAARRGSPAPRANPLDGVLFNRDK